MDAPTKKPRRPRATKAEMAARRTAAELNPPKPKRHRRTKAEMAARRAAAELNPPKPKRHRRTKAEMAAWRAEHANDPPKQRKRKFFVRATREQMAERQRVLIEIVTAGWPMTVRQVYYQATVLHLVDKDEAGYGRVQRALTKLRRSTAIPYNWIVDTSRRAIAAYTCSGPEQSFRDAADDYRKSLWDKINAYVEIWIEKDALSGVISPITRKYDVTLMPARGYSSISFLHRAASRYHLTEEQVQDSAEQFERIGKPIYIYQFGDFDPSGDNAGEVIERELRAFAPHADIHFKHVAVTPEQIRDWNLPSRPNKKDDPRRVRFEEKYNTDQSVELDAINPNQLRDMVEQCILNHMSREQYAALMIEEERERVIQQNWITKLTGPRWEEAYQNYRG